MMGHSVMTKRFVHMTRRGYDGARQRASLFEADSVLIYSGYPPKVYHVYLIIGRP